jgi:formamidopyrimidine-DNA glycosylase
MPELPEVEVTRRRIEPLLVGRTIAAVRTSRPSYFFLTPPARLRRALPGRTVRSLRRRGKYLALTLDDGRELVLHLGMTGQLFVAGARSPRLLSARRRAALAPEQQHDFRPDRHTHLELRFRDGGPAVLFRDVRKFGKVFLVEDGASHPRLSRLGPDALEVTPEQVWRAAHRRRAPIKSVLLDQSVIAGTGNIYADEALFRAGVRPGRSAGRVTRRDAERIVASMRAVMLRSIDTGGASISDFVAPDGRDGEFQRERCVYAREGEPCFECATPIRRIVIGQRSSHYCARCQR